jgi:hypothetical protein
LSFHKYTLTKESTGIKAGRQKPVLCNILIIKSKSDAATHKNKALLLTQQGLTISIQQY